MVGIKYEDGRLNGGIVCIALVFSRLQNDVNPYIHHLLIHPCLRLASVLSFRMKRDKLACDSSIPCTFED
jgi:hypothetical protein